MLLLLKYAAQRLLAKLNYNDCVLTVLYPPKNRKAYSRTVESFYRITPTRNMPLLQFIMIIPHGDSRFCVSTKSQF